MLTSDSSCQISCHSCPQRRSSILLRCSDPPCNRLWAPASRCFANIIFNNHVQLYSIFPKTHHVMDVWLSSKDHWVLADHRERYPSLTDSIGTLHRQRRTQKAVGEYNLSTEQHQSSYSHGILSSPIELLSSLHDPHTTTTPGVQFHANATLSTIRKLSNTSLPTLCAKNDAFSAKNSNCGQECDSCCHKDHIWSGCCIHVCPQAYIRRPHSFMMQAANSANDEQEQSGVVESAVLQFFLFCFVYL